MVRSPEQLLAVLADLVGSDAAEALRRAALTLGATGAVARFDKHEIAATATNVPGVIAAALAGGDEQWGAVTCVPGANGAVALWFEGERVLAEHERTFVRGLAAMIAQSVELANVLEAKRATEFVVARRARCAESLAGAVGLVLSGASLDRVLDELARICCEAPADTAGIRVLSADGSELAFRGIYHRDPVECEKLRQGLLRSLPKPRAEVGQAMATGKTVLVPSVDLSEVRASYVGTAVDGQLEQIPLSSMIVVPLRSRGSAFGVVAAVRPARVPFTQADVQFLEEIAVRITLVIETAKLVESLKRSQDELQVALDAGRLGAWEWDIVAGTVRWSPLLERIHGLEVGTFGGTFEAYQHDIHPDDREHVLAGIRRVVEERIDHHIHYRIVLPDGRLRWLEAHGRLVCDAAGEPLRLIGVCTDITEAREAEAQLREMVLALRLADQRKNEYLAMLAHELRNPLGPMINATMLLRAGEEVEPWLDVLDRQLRHMARLLDDLLDVSRITRGKIQLVRGDVDLTALTREVVEDQEESFRAAGLSLEIDAVPTALVVVGDRTRLAQVLGNLLSNALKFSERGQLVRVGIAQEQTRAVVTVCDHGIGIPPQMLEQIFEPFVQADTSLSRERGGLGLGLAVVKALVEQHDGFVSASSGGPGMGTELRVELPLKQPLGANARSSAGAGR